MSWNAEDTTRNDGIHVGFLGFHAEMGESDLRAFVGSDSESDNAEEPEALVKGYMGEVEKEEKSGWAEELRKLIKRKKKAKR